MTINSRVTKDGSRRLTLSEDEIGLLLEGIDMLEMDWAGTERGHPELDALMRLKDKLDGHPRRRGSKENT